MTRLKAHFFKCACCKNLLTRDANNPEGKCKCGFNNTTLIHGERSKR